MNENKVMMGSMRCLFMKTCPKLTVFLQRGTTTCWDSTHKATAVSCRGREVLSEVDVTLTHLLHPPGTVQSHLLI